VHSPHQVSLYEVFQKWTNTVFQSFPDLVASIAGFSEGAVLEGKGHSLAANKRLLLRNLNKHLLQTSELHFDADNMDD